MPGRERLQPLPRPTGVPALARTLVRTLALIFSPGASPSPSPSPHPNLFRDRQDADDKNRQTLVFAEMCELHTTYYLLLTIHYLLPTTAYLPLPTYH